MLCKGMAGDEVSEHLLLPPACLGFQGRLRGVGGRADPERKPQEVGGWEMQYGGEQTKSKHGEWGMLGPGSSLFLAGGCFRRSRPDDRIAPGEGDSLAQHAAADLLSLLFPL